jgi:RNA polymerase sigma factor (sigma-70 family)
MRQRTATPYFAGVFAPVLSLDALVARREAEGGPAFDIPDDAPGVEACIEHAEAMAAVEHFVGSLPPRDQEIVESLYWRDQTQTEIAARFGVSKMAISKAVARIFKHGRVTLAEHEHFAFIN